MDILSVIKPGSYTTVQDAGRFEFQHMGVPVSGALDKFAYQAANFLVGNTENQAVLESTFIGPELRVVCQSTVAITGARTLLRLNGKAIDAWQSIHVEPGDILSIGQAVHGCRSYIAVGGGIDVPAVLGSRSTYIGGKIGGIAGRALMTGDIIRGMNNLPHLEAPRRFPRQHIPVYADEILLRTIPGPQCDHFSSGAISAFYSSLFTISPKADRMGYRLQGPLLQSLANMPDSIVSEPVLPGAIQVPPDGQPIILLGEQTIGGYAKIATIISTDLDRLAQAAPGNSIRFRPVSIETAHDLYLRKKHLLNALVTAWMPERLKCI